MQRYALTRLAAMVPLLLGISIALFALSAAAPGDPVDLLILNNPDVHPEDLVRLRHLYGLDKPMYVRYVTWLLFVSRGDLGWSVNYKLPVVELLKERLPASLVLMSTGLFLSVVIAIPVGVYSAFHQYSMFDYTASLAAFAGFSLPLFWLGLIMIYVFAVKLKWLPPSGIQSPGVTGGWLAAADYVRHLILPAVVIAMYNVASLARYTRASLLDVGHQDFVRTARAKGLSPWRVATRHTLRNGLIPVVTMLGLMVPLLFGGAPVTETVFAWPGIGQLLLQSVLIGDYLVAIAIMMCIAVLIVVSNLAADILYGFLDPRIRYE